MRLDDFDFALPDELIAQEPAARRDGSRLMRLHRGRDLPPTHHHFNEIVTFLEAGDLLVLNDTRVIPARLFASKPTGGKVELLFLNQLSSPGERVISQSGVSTLHVRGTLLQSSEDGSSQSDDGSSLAQVSERERWLVLARASRPLREGSCLRLPEGQEALVEVALGGGQYELSFSLRGGLLSFLERHGEMPLPPYIDPKHGSVDHRNRYQTVYAARPGAVAAPTAGLHFTQELLDALQRKGVKLATLTLHVGLGTFAPVRVEDIREHQMHEERYEISVETAAAWHETRTCGGRVIAVGTTALRALESAIHPTEERLRTGPNSTSIFLYPGHQIRSIDGLLTNFHLPRSTLMMLVSAFHGRERILRAYAEAVKARYRFFSYGDAMLIL